MRPITATILSGLLLAAAAVPRGHAQSPPVPTAARIVIARDGAGPARKAPAENFTGTVTVAPVFRAGDGSTTSGSFVTFQPGARTAWHTHPEGQTLIVTAGTGWVGGWGAPVREMRTGEVVRIPPGVKHWHGATQTSTMTHVAIQDSRDGKPVDWLEKVGDEQYRP